MLHWVLFWFRSNSRLVIKNEYRFLMFKLKNIADYLRFQIINWYHYTFPIFCVSLLYIFWFHVDFDIFDSTDALEDKTTWEIYFPKFPHSHKIRSSVGLFVRASSLCTLRRSAFKLKCVWNFVSHNFYSCNSFSCFFQY